MLTRLPNIPYAPCVARVEGPDAAMDLMLNNAGEPLITVARPEWRNSRLNTPIELSIDGAASLALTGDMVANLVVVHHDPPTLAKIVSAHRLTWTLPMGRFNVDVDGLGVALDAVRACVRARDGASGATAS